jgi:xanthine dehydrogenase large subunit
MFVIEAAIDKAARALGVSPALIQSKNLLSDAQEFPYGQRTEAAQAQAAWEKIAPKLAEKRAEADAFNTQNLYLKKGVAMMPICFGISFTNTMMNHARALVHIYSDGSVGVSTGAVEMGQGVNTKMIQVAAACFGIHNHRIKLESTNTSRVANTSPTAASATADLNGNALIDACKQLLERLEQAARHQLQLPKPSNGETSFYIQDEQVYVDGQVRLLDWVGLINSAFVQRCNLSAKGHYATPEIHFDKQTGKGHPFAYHVYGVALTTCTVNCIKGTYTIDTVDIAHDFGNSFSPHIDLGQIEGGLVQGIGWMTLEEVIYNEQGRLLSNALSTYKIPDVYSVPKSIDISFLQNQGARLGILKSKAVGEPPLMYGIGAYFALRDALQAFNPKTNIQYNAPMTPEKVLMGLYNK